MVWLGSRSCLTYTRSAASTLRRVLVTAAEEVVRCSAQTVRRRALIMAFVPSQLQVPCGGEVILLMDGPSSDLMLCPPLMSAGHPRLVCMMGACEIA